MTHPTLRTSVRAIALNLSLGAAALAVTGGVTSTSVDAATVHFIDSGVSTARAYELQDARIVASTSASWGFDSPEFLVIPAPTVNVRLHAALQVATVNNPAPPSIEGNSVLEFAATFVGVPYVIGGSTPAGFDCTGFIQYVYANFGISVPRVSSSYWDIGTRVSAADAQPGDLIVSNGHVGIYAGANMQIDSPRPGKTIQFRSIWQTSYVFVRVS